MFKGTDLLKAKLGEVSAKTISLGGKGYLRGRNEQKIKFQEEFAYPRLSSPRCIRLLKIHAGKDIDVICCDVFEVDLDKKPSFEALSYTWDLDLQWSMMKLEAVEDTKKEERPILCNGKTHHVTMNLYHALTELRRQKMETPLWADQICINQHDSDEKVAQLAIMVDIFRSATRVTIWLGKLNMLRNNALDYMEALPDEPLPPIRIPSNSEATMSKLTFSIEAVTSWSSSVGESFHWLSVLFVLARQWFQRAWTLQEFLLATDFRILMGAREISPQAINKAASRVIDFFATDPLSTHMGVNVSFLTLRRFIQGRATLFDEREKFQQGKRYSAEEYLGVIRVRRATEMKDKVIAGSALLKQYAPSSTDYRSTTLEIYISYAVECLWPETGIFSLSLVGGGEPHTEGLPSWMPDLDSLLRPESLRNCGCPVFKTPFLSERGDFTIDNKTLHLRIAKCDIIKEVGESIWSWTRYDEEAYNSHKRFKMRTSGSETNERFGLMFSLLNKLGTTYAPTGEHTIDVFWQTLIGGINSKSKDNISLWRTRFQQWFAFTLVSIRSNFYTEKKDATKRLMRISSPKKWMVPLIADQDRLEERVFSFLDLHDTHMDSATPSDSSLQKTISHITKRLWGTERIEDSGFWKESAAELLSAVRSEEFYSSISFFGQHFESIYDGRRIFVSEKGYLGTGVEGVRVGDLIVFVVGGDVPYVLRPVEDRENTYTLVGEAYVHGIMSGEKEVMGELKVESVRIM
ncbi:hypothetical protein EJ08DRAFT_619328 [Tothia fuscella]|uniref:Heterokaryon incompatibility domain-containing protein n=1 Tax=Tothia fuscella TaxID=1048955 RepID=A0A9P4TUQ4_9PEZI|nr:hypothetical protein EJ08DRAFT_619328 [Tothia fuscella]